MASEQSGRTRGESGLGETVRVIIHALILALIVRTFLYQPFNIPSGSMKANLLIGDYLFVSKFSYGYSKYSFPFSPSLFDGRIWDGTPKRGDIAVFKLPRDNETDYIKRVIGLPGDRIQMRAGVLHINGEAVRREPVEAFIDDTLNGPAERVRQYRETLPNGVSYTILDMVENSSGDNTEVYTVPPGHYFMMGDNRDNSTDSRYLSAVGYVPHENLIGRADIIFFSIREGGSFWAVWEWPRTIRWNRIFSMVR